MSRAGTVVGLAVAIVGVGALPVALESTSGAVDLAVRVPARHQVLRDDRDQGTWASVFPNHGVTRSRSPSNSGARLDLATYGIDYGEAWHREVTLPSLVGRFADEGFGVCGYSVHLGAALFDTDKAGRGIKTAVHRRVVEKFPHSIDDEDSGIHVRLPDVRSTDFDVAFVEGYAWIRLEVVLADTTRFAVRFPVRVTARAGVPFVERVREVPPTVEFTGPVREQLVQQGRNKGTGYGAGLGCAAGAAFGGPIGCGLGMLLGALAGNAVGESMANTEIPKRAEAMAESKIDEMLEEFGLGMKKLSNPIHPNAKRPRDAIKLALRQDPQVSRDGLSFTLCASITAAAPKTDASIHGSPFWESPSPTPPAGPEAAISIALNDDAVQQVIYYAWQSGVLAEAGMSSFVLQRMPDEIRLAAFDFTGFAPQLPPVLDRSRGGLAFVVGDVNVGTMGKKDVVTHGVLTAGITQAGSALKLSASVEKLWLNCVAHEPGAYVLSPCMSDILPIVREKAIGRPLEGTIAGGDILAKLPRLTFEGMTVKVSNLRVNTTGSPLRVSIGVNANIEATP